MDRGLYGHRAQAVLALATITAVLGLWEWWNDAPPLFTVLTTFVMIFGCELLGLARLGSLRDDAGNWSMALTHRWLRGLFADGWDNIADFAKLSGALKLQGLGKASVAVGLALLVVRNVLVALGRAGALVGFGSAARFEQISGSLLVVGICSLMCGALVWTFGWWKLRSHATRAALVVAPRDRERISMSWRALPPLIDCSDREATLRLAGDLGHPLLRETLLALADWKPKLHRYEDDYQRSLFRYMRRQLPAASPERERPLVDPRTHKAGRADLVVGNTVLIEMKLDLSAASVHRAVTQVEQYVRSWEQGPVLLLVCAADVETVRRRLGFELEQLHQRAPVSLVVAAGTRR